MSSVLCSFYQFTGALDDAADAGLADEHVMGFFGQHELARSRERIEGALGEGEQLIFAVAVGEHREHEEREPVAMGSLNVVRIRGLSALPERRCNSFFASSRPSLPK